MYQNTQCRDNSPHFPLFPTSDSRLPIPDSRFPTPDSRFPNLDPLCSSPN
ncbi:MAG: hypothetical protein F6J90_24355 [Moorea sp. SIOASIH]|nr:hypothetical protein [Moorena sp. SIOASIH]NEO39299.1 hypothetical protein [Moorena sp. SIOASIH]